MPSSKAPRTAKCYRWDPDHPQQAAETAITRHINNTGRIPQAIWLPVNELPEDAAEWDTCGVPVKADPGAFKRLVAIEG